MRTLAQQDFRAFARDRHVDATRASDARLAPTVLVTNESGINGEVAEQLTPTDWARVEFELPGADPAGGELLFYVNAADSTQQQPMRIEVNGHRLAHRQRRERMLTGGWDRCRIPSGWLRAGTNQIVFSQHGTLYVDPAPGGLAEAPASRSRRSFDAGRTWHAGAHGPTGQLSGEYLVRLRLRGFPPSGWLTSPVIDLAAPDGALPVAPSGFAADVSLTIQADTPAGTGVELQVRSGSMPAFDARTWSAWLPAAAGQRARRFLQWRAHLHTTCARTTPRLRRVDVQVRPTAAGGGAAACRVAACEQPELTHSSYPFTFMAPNLRQQRLRQQYRLDQVIAAGASELEQLALLRDWVHSQWLGWQSAKYPYCPPWDPLEILEVTKGNWGYGMCTHYAATFVGCAAALGFVCRSVVVDHHCLAEVWSDDLQKWILQDPGPAREFDATYELDGVPLNALELHRLLARGQAHRVEANRLPQNDREPMALHLATFVRFGSPLRNDHLVNPEPAELHHGQGQYHWDGYLWWSDAAVPRYPEYSLQTCRPQDLYWAANQTRMHLEQTGEHGLLRVLFEHTMPNFSHFTVRRDGGEWVRHDQLVLDWPLRPGHNCLEAAAVNAFGRQGRASSVAAELIGPAA